MPDQGDRHTQPFGPPQGLLVPYFRVDDGWWSHPKTMALSDAAQALWVRAGAWSMQHYTDGLIPDSALAMLGAKPKLVAELVAVGYWEKVLPGHQFHDWSEYQETAESLKTRRDKNKERMRAVRAHNTHTNDDTDHARARAVSDVIPSHPIPSLLTQVSETRPVLETGDDEPGTDDDEVPSELVSRAQRLGVDLPKIRRALSKQAGHIVEAETVLAGIVQIVSRAKPRKGDRTGLVLSSLHSDWAEWQRLLMQESA